MRARKITLILNATKQVNDITVESLQLQHAKSSQRIFQRNREKRTNKQMKERKSCTLFSFNTGDVNFICV